MRRPFQARGRFGIQTTAVPLLLALSELDDRQNLGDPKFRAPTVAVEAPSRSARRVVVKARIVKNTPRSARAAALHLERDGAEKDGTKAVLSGADGVADRSPM